jgi:hypothetical protein
MGILNAKEYVKKKKFENPTGLIWGACLFD